MATVIPTTFKLKRGIAARWAEVNPVLAQGEPGFVYDTNKLKIGDGITPWNSLPYIEGSTGIETVNTYADLPSVGNELTLYRVITDKALYQYNVITNSYDVITSEAQIAAAVAAETKAREDAVAGVQGEVDAVEGRMDTAEGKITNLETESAKHAVKTEVEAALELKADKTALEATNKTLTDVKTTVDNFFAEDAAINDTIDILKEIANYIATDKEGAADITARVGALEGKVDVDKVSEAIDADVKVETDRATAAESVLAGRLDVLEKIDHDAYVAADTALKTELNAEIAKKADSATMTTELDKKADKTQVATDIATAKSEAEAKAAELDAALKTELQKEIDDDVKALADTVYTKTDIEALLTWGSF